MDRAHQTKLAAPQYLRGIAALMVVYLHWATNGGNPAFDANLLHMTALAPQGYGHLLASMSYWEAYTQSTWLFDFNFGAGGVALFFMISGFVIAISVERLSIGQFAMKRALRLLPPLWAAILIWMALNWLISSWGLAKLLPVDPLTLLANALLIQDIANTHHLDEAYWTLIVEVKFYIAMALMVVAARRISLASVFVTAAVMAAIVIGLHFTVTEDQQGYIYPLFGRSLPFAIFMLIGTVIFLWWDRRIPLWVAVPAAAAVYGLFVLTMNFSPNRSYNMHYVEECARAAVLFWMAMLVQRANLPWPAPFRAIGWVLNWLGNVSYPLYLLHSLVGVTIITVVRIYSGGDTWLALAVAAAVVFPLALLIHLYVERPCQRFRIAPNSSWGGSGGRPRLHSSNAPPPHPDQTPH